MDEEERAWYVRVASTPPARHRVRNGSGARRLFGDHVTDQRSSMWRDQREQRPRSMVDDIVDDIVGPQPCGPWQIQTSYLSGYPLLVRVDLSRAMSATPALPQ